MSFDDMRKKYAGLKAHQEQLKPAEDPFDAWNSFEKSLTGIVNEAVLPAAEDAKTFLAEHHLAPLVRSNDPIRTIGGDKADRTMIDGVKQSLVTVSFALPTGKLASGGAYHGGQAQVVVATKWMQLSLLVFATNPHGGAYEQRATIEPKKATRERFSVELANAIDWILDIRAKPYM